MSVLYIALPIALLLGGAGLWACLYCIRDGQYDDLDSASVRMLVEDRPVSGIAGNGSHAVEGADDVDSAGAGEETKEPVRNESGVSRG